MQQQQGMRYQQQQQQLHQQHQHQHQQMQRMLMAQGAPPGLQQVSGGGGAGGGGGGGGNMYLLPSNSVANGSSKGLAVSGVGQQMMMQHQSHPSVLGPQAGEAYMSMGAGGGGGAPFVSGNGMPGGNMGTAGGMGSMNALFGHNQGGRRSHEQARFSPLVQVLRDNMVATGAKEMDAEVIAQSLGALMPDYRERLAVTSVIEYLQEAQQAGLVMVHRSGKQVMASIRGNREVGVVKWVKESYGFIQSAAHAEDLFYHGSEVRANRLLCATDEVEFLVVRNPFTGKLNATQV